MGGLAAFRRVSIIAALLRAGGVAAALAGDLAAAAVPILAFKAP